MNERNKLMARIGQEIQMYQAIFKDARTPWTAKVLLGAALAYLVSPIDLIPDCIPVLGALDDLLIVPGLIWLAVKLIPPDLLTEHRRRLRP